MTLRVRIMKPRIMYVERKESLSGGDAYYGRVTFSKSGKTIYYRGMIFERFPGYKYNHVERKTGDAYWMTIRNMPERVEQSSRF